MEPAASNTTEPGDGKRGLGLERDLSQAGEALLELAQVRWQRLRLAVKESAHGALLALWLALVGSVVSIAAAVLLVTGLAGALTELAGGRVWFGRLTIGALGVLIGWTLLRSLRTRMRRLFVASMSEPAKPTRQTLPDQALPDQALPDQALPDQVLPNQEPRDAA